MIPGSRESGPSIRHAAAFFFFAIVASTASADYGYVTARSVASAYGLTFKDLSTGTIRACKLVGGEDQFVFFAGLSNVLVNGASASLPRPVRWDGRSLLLPAEVRDIIAKHIGPPVRPSALSIVRQTRPFKVVIDAGHGGKDPGAIGPAGLREKDVNLDIALTLARYLERHGVEVVLTRTTDRFVSLSERVRIANCERPDLFISIHANAEVSRRRYGAMSLYPDDGTRDGRPGIMGRAKSASRRGGALLASFGAGGPAGPAALLAVVSAALETYRVRSIRAAHYIQEALAPVTGCVRKANGIIEDFRGLRVLRGTHAPAVLVEVDFISNRTSERKLRQSSYRRAIAEAVGRAVMRFLKNTGED